MVSARGSPRSLPCESQGYLVYPELATATPSFFPSFLLFFLLYVSPSNFTTVGCAHWVAYSSLKFLEEMKGVYEGCETWEVPLLCRLCLDLTTKAEAKVAAT